MSARWRGPWGDRVARWTLFQWLLLFTVLAFAGAIWVAPLPPSVDFPQHAGQISLLRDIWLGKSPWAEEMRLNLFSPYVLPYLLAVPVSLIMPAVAALKVVLTAAYALFAFNCVALSGDVGSDRRLHWLLVPTYFGYSWKWGFFPFLVAAPLGILLVRLAFRYSERPQFKTALWIAFWGTVLFFCHGLVLVMVIAIGALLLLCRQRVAGTLFLAAWPYTVLAILIMAFVFFSPAEHSASAISFKPVWRWSLEQLEGSMLIASWGTPEDGAFAALDLIIAIALLLLWPRFEWRSVPAWVPVAVILVIVVAAPLEIFKTALIQSRFALFLLPFFALMFRSRDDLRAPRVRSIAGETMLCFGCLIFLAVFVHRQLAFAVESRAFDAVLAELEPGHRVLSMVFDRSSPAANHDNAYLHYALRYQVEKGGLVDVNFASYPQAVVKFADGHMPRAVPFFDWYPEEFDWREFDANRYRYIILRHTGWLPEDLFAGNNCRLRLVKSSGPWVAFESTNCEEQSTN